MEKICFKLVFNRKKKLNRNGKAPVQIEACQQSKKVYISTNVYLKPGQWDRKTQEVVSHPNSELLNRYLQEYILRIEWKELQMWKNDTPLSLEQLKTSVNGNERIYKDRRQFTDFCKEYIYTSRKRDSTKKNLITTVKLIDIFKTKMSFSDLTYDFIIGFEKFMSAREYKANTIIKHIKHLRSFYNEAVNRKLINNKEDPFRRYRMLRGETKYTFLLPEELVVLEEFAMNTRIGKLSHTLDAFLFCCYTGLRYSDFCSLSHENLIKIDNKEWLIYRSVKTEVESRLPLYLLFNGKAIYILNKYRHDTDSFFRIKSNSAIDKQLKKIKYMSGINTHISFHTARHTNATLLVYKGVNITTVQKLLGHKNIKTTQHYADILPQGIVNDLEKNA